MTTTTTTTTVMQQGQPQMQQAQVVGMPMMAQAAVPMAQAMPVQGGYYDPNDVPMVMAV